MARLWLATQVFLGFSLAAASPAAAGTAFTLDQAIAEAEGHSPELKKLELAADSAGWRKLEALSAHLPHLGVNATHFLSAKYSILGVVFGGSAIEFPTAYPQTDIQVEASLLLFDGLSSINLYRASLLGSEAADLDYSRGKFRLDESIRGLFYDALAAQDLAQVADLDIKTLEDHLALIRASEEAGAATRVDVLRLEAQLEEARAEKLLADDNVELRKRALFVAIGEEPQAVPLEGSLPEPDPKRVPADLKADVSSREDLQAQTKREEAADRANSAAAAFWVPRVTLFGNEEFYKYGSFNPVILPNATFQNAYSVGLRFSWNIFDGGASIARKGQADDRALDAAESTRQLQLASPEEFETWKRRYAYNATLFRARQVAVTKSKESVRLATLAAKAGARTHTEVLDAELELFRARAGLIQAQVDAAKALSNLELALGRKL